MPFEYGPWPFNGDAINRIIEGGGVYGLAMPSWSDRTRYIILYVGKSVNLRKRLRDHLNNPPVVGITHFFAEAHTGEATQTAREYALIQEFKPIGNTLLK